MKDRISALMDGELDERSAAQALEALATDREALDAWRNYHLISDALAKSRMLSTGFTERVAAALDKEPTVLAPRRPKSEPPRRWLAIAASVAAVALVGWLGFAPQPQPVAPVAPVAQAPAPAAAPQASPQVVPLPSGAHDYLLAHQGFSPRVSLQGMMPYVRTVSEQVQEPRR